MDNVTGTNFQSNPSKDPSPNADFSGSSASSLEESFPRERSYSSSNNGEFDSIAELAELEEEEGQWVKNQEELEKANKKGEAYEGSTTPGFDETLDMAQDGQE